MPKKIKFESFVYRFLAEADAVRHALAANDARAWQAFVEQLNFAYEAGHARVSRADVIVDFPLSEADFYRRGDSTRYVEEQRASSLVFGSDTVQKANADYFREAVVRVARSAGFEGSLEAAGPVENAARLQSEEVFHDEWAASEDPDSIDVLQTHEACTSPELRYIREQMGELAGKRLLDVGCGLGEASVYFALKGAQVTAMDLSEGMLQATSKLAHRYGVRLRTHKAAAEQTNLPAGETFDVIYAGNLLHHVDIEQTLKLLKPHLAPGGVFVSWDPVAYNPLINVYRVIATKVRTTDEHPIRLKDLRLIRRQFRQVSTRYFWLTTLALFVWMAIAQRRDPNKERFWKSVVKESGRWEPVYRPLEKLDTFLLRLLPPLRLLCWNVVIVARDPG